MREVDGRSRLMVCPAERLAEMFRLRASVWIGEGADPAAFPDGEWRNERDASRLHWIVLDEGRVVATASLGIYAAIADVEEGEAYLRAGLSSPGPVAAPARVTVAAECRGRGLVRALLDAQDTAAVEAGAVLA